MLVLQKNKVSAKLYYSSKNGINRKEMIWYACRPIIDIMCIIHIIVIFKCDPGTKTLIKLIGYLRKYPCMIHSLTCDKGGTTDQREKVDCLGVCGGKTVLSWSKVNLNFCLRPHTNKDSRIQEWIWNRTEKLIGEGVGKSFWWPRSGDDILNLRSTNTGWLWRNKNTNTKSFCSTKDTLDSVNRRWKGGERSF